MMTMTELYTGDDNQSHFRLFKIYHQTQHPLSNYSEEYLVKSMLFRNFEANLVFDWHNTSQSQYIIYLEGKIGIEISNGEKRIFEAGEVLFANDLPGQGHITKTLSQERSIIIALSK